MELVVYIVMKLDVTKDRIWFEFVQDENENIWIEEG
jgi:hypothetical protein